MEVIQFEARRVETWLEDGVQHVTWAASDHPDAERFSLQRDTTDPGASYYCERSDQDQGCYGGIAQLHLTRTQLLVWLTPKGSDRLGCDLIMLHVSVSEARYAELRATMQRVLAGTGLIE
ncbi:hypothetical protein FAES_3995 [Fibrella aestuarina BUZ 2]|uniref:Uncharacterized protein n=1 Tax=Fibrella aestuarina BUZ 2 TaxID=1166018 RepID=I0KCZ3_9BACT|nr:Imm10 family immunity protein [Fibrella aestuarina]CCH01996.1 hypothetical protein FAES_3995 [Fibrella aestuarina BUZ 2]